MQAPNSDDSWGAPGGGRAAAPALRPRSRPAPCPAPCLLSQVPAPAWGGPDAAQPTLPQPQAEGWGLSGAAKPAGRGAALVFPAASLGSQPGHQRGLQQRGLRLAFRDHGVEPGPSKCDLQKVFPPALRQCVEKYLTEVLSTMPKHTTAVYQKDPAHERLRMPGPQLSSLPSRPEQPGISLHPVFIKVSLDFGGEGKGRSGHRRSNRR